MKFFDDIISSAQTAVSKKGNEIGDYLGGVITDVFVKAGEPKAGNQTAADIAAKQQQAKVASMLTLAVPIGLGLVALAMFAKRK